MTSLTPSLLAPRQRRRQHVVVVSPVYPPEPTMFAPAIAAAAAQEGHEVTVVTGYPNRPGGKLYPQYRQRFAYSEVIDDITVHRVPLVVNHTRNPIQRIANFLTFSISALSVSPKISNADVVYVYATPATAAIPAQIWKKLYGIPYVLHVQDLWPESVTDSGMLGRGVVNKAAGGLLNVWLKRLYGNAAGLIAISAGMRQLLIDRGMAPDRCFTVHNWAAEDEIVVKPDTRFAPGGLNLLYAGNLGPMQDLETVIAAARRLDAREGLALNIAGEGILEDQLRTAAEGAGNIRFLGNLSLQQVAQQYLAADFQLVTLKDTPIFRTTIPSKLQSSLAAGVPVITTVGGDVANLIRDHHAGIVAEPENPASLAAAFTTAYEMTPEERAQMGANARKLYEEKMSHRAATDDIVTILHHNMKHHSQRALVEEPS